MRNAILLLTIGAMVTFHPSGAEAQSRALAFDARGAYSFPFGDFGDVVDSDFGFGFVGTVGLTPTLGIYGGWGRDAFDCDLCSDDEKVHSSGFEAGLALRGTPGVGRGMIPWVRAGVIAHRVSFDAGVAEFESDRKFGLQAAGGLEFPLGEVLSVSPGVRVHFLDLDDPGEGAFLEDPEVRHFAFDLAARIRIPR